MNKISNFLNQNKIDSRVLLSPTGTRGKGKISNTNRGHILSVVYSGCLSLSVMGVTTAEDMSPNVKIMVQLWFYSYLLGCMLLGQFHKLSVPIFPMENGGNNSAFLCVTEILNDPIQAKA